MISTKPKNSAQAAALARARQLTDFKWTPLRDVPSYIKFQKSTPPSALGDALSHIMPQGHYMLPAGVEVTGFPYSSTEEFDKFFTENVSFESFLSAIANPHSKLYQPGHGASGNCNYGVVCNGFVRYALGIRRRYSTAKWFDIPGMYMVAERNQYTVDDLQLLDILFAFGEGRNHVSLITDILREEDGSVALVEVSEAVRPTCVRRQFTPDDFYQYFSLFALCRYDLLDQVPTLDEEQDKLLWESGIEKITPKITVDNGNRSNYLVGDEILISVLTDCPDTVELLRNGALVNSIPTFGRAMIPLLPERGYYTARLKEAGDFVEFCVNEAEISHEVHGDTVTVFADPCDEKSKILYAEYRIESKLTTAPLDRCLELTEEEKQALRFTRPLTPKSKNFKVYFENEYGVWVHQMTRI